MWGVISSAKIGTEKVIPAMQQSETGEIMALASRSKETSKRVCENLGIPRFSHTLLEVSLLLEASAMISPVSLCCIAGITFSVPILALLITPHIIFDIFA